MSRYIPRRKTKGQIVAEWFLSTFGAPTLTGWLIPAAAVAALLLAFALFGGPHQ